MKNEQIRNLAISGVDTLEKANKVCEIVGDTKVKECFFSEEYKWFYDYGDDIDFMVWYHDSHNNFKNCTQMTYKEFLEKYDKPTRFMPNVKFNLDIKYDKQLSQLLDSLKVSDAKFFGYSTSSSGKMLFGLWAKDYGELDLPEVGYLDAIPELVADEPVETKSDGKFNGGYIEAFENKSEIYETIINSGVICGATFDWDAGYWYIEDNQLKHANIEYLLYFKFKQFYINNGALSWDESKEIPECENCGEHGVHTDEPHACLSHPDKRVEPTIITQESVNAQLNELDKKANTISIKDDNGKEYKFAKPELECELLKVVKDSLYIIGYVEVENCIYPCQWKVNSGGCYLNGEWQQQYNLTPIKPEWYEDKSNFPALILHSN